MAGQVHFERFLDARPVGRSAVQAAGHDAGSARLRLIPFAGLSAQDMARWQQLGEQAATQSAFAQPWFMLHSLAQCDPAGKSQLAIVDDADGTWLGALPLVRANWIGRAPLPCWQAWSHPNRFVGTPLVQAGSERRFWRDLLAGLGQASPHELALCLSDLAADDPVTQALLEVCAADRSALAIDKHYSRPMLRPGDPPVTSAKQRRRIESLERKLARDLGPAEFRLIRDPGLISAQIPTFFALEKSGWKGELGSALACSRSNAALFTAIVEASAALGKCHLAELSVRGRVLSQSIQFDGKERIYGFKMAYDEIAAAYAPGLLLLDWLTREHTASATAWPIDSCARPGQQPVSRLWHDRCELIDCRIALGGELRRGVLRALVGGEIAYSALKRLISGSLQPLKT